MITSAQMHGDLDGVDLACSAVLWFPALPVIIVSDSALTVPDGCIVLDKPCMPDAIRQAVETAMPRPAAQGAAIASSEGKATQATKDTQVSYGN